MRLRSYMSPGFPRSLFELVGSLIGADVDFDETRSGPEPGEDPFATGEIDLGWICSTSFAAMALASDPPTVQLVGVAWVPQDDASAGEPRYFGDLVIRSGLTAPDGSPIHAIDDLAGATIGCNDEVSLSGHWSLRFALEQAGHDPDDFAETVFTGGHHRSLDLVAAGELDAAVTDSVIRSVRASTDDAVASLAVPLRLGPWPVQPLVARADLSPGEVGRIRGTLLDADSSTDSPLGRELRAAGLTSLVAVEPDHYGPVLDALDLQEWRS